MRGTGEAKLGGLEWPSKPSELLTGELVNPHQPNMARVAAWTRHRLMIESKAYGEPSSTGAHTYSATRPQSIKTDAHSEIIIFNLSERPSALSTSANMRGCLYCETRLVSSAALRGLD